MNIPQLEKEKVHSYNPAFQKNDYSRLKTLYGMSKLLSMFESVDTSFPEILSLAAEGFPLLTAVLIEHWEPEVKTAVWQSEEATQDQVDLATINARKSYSYLAGNTHSQTEDLQTDTVSQSELPPTDKEQKINTNNNENYIVLPLVIDKLPPFGAFQLQGSKELNENDLEFVGAVADLMAVALDRYYKTKKERELSKKHAEISADKITVSKEKITDLETERELREVFISLLSHDLRTPLSAALMSAQMIQRKTEDPEACLSLSGRIVNNIKRADEMIVNLLDANRIRSGEKLPLNIELFDMSNLIKGTLEEMTSIYGDRFVYEARERIDGHWDRKGVRRIIENLCSNAIKYGSAQTPIQLSLSQKESVVQISVMNRGGLITAEDQVNLFKHFRRSEEAEKSTIRGWGIGLTLVRGVAEAHGGSVVVESTPEKGTIFTVRIPKDARGTLKI